MIFILTKKVTPAKAIESDYQPDICDGGGMGRQAQKIRYGQVLSQNHKHSIPHPAKHKL